MSISTGPLAVGGGGPVSPPRPVALPTSLRHTEAGTADLYDKDDRLVGSFADPATAEAVMRTLNEGPKTAELMGSLLALLAHFQSTRYWHERRQILAGRVKSYLQAEHR